MPEMKLRWRLGWYLLFPLVRVLFNLKVEGREHLKNFNAILVAANHVSFLDPPILGLAARRELYFIAKAELFQTNRFFSWLIRTYNALPVRRDAGDLSILRTVSRLLRRGLAVVVFPEGTRSKIGSFLGFRPGIGWLAIQNDVVVVPCYIYGTSDSFSEMMNIVLRRKSMGVRFGHPILSRGFAKSREAYVKLTERIRSAVEELKGD